MHKSDTPFRGMIPLEIQTPLVCLKHLQLGFQSHGESKGHESDITEPKQEDFIPPVAINRPGISGTSRGKRESETNHVALLEPSLSSHQSQKSDTGWCLYQEPSNRLESYTTCQRILKSKQESLGQVRLVCVLY